MPSLNQEDAHTTYRKFQFDKFVRHRNCSLRNNRLLGPMSYQWVVASVSVIITSSLHSYPLHSDFKRSIHNPQSCILHLPVTKTHWHGQDIILVDQAALSILFLYSRTISRSATSRMMLIFFPMLLQKGFFSLTKSLFIQCCNTIWSRLGYPRTTGHSFRIGRTTELLITGTPPDVVRVTGWWSSASFLRYWRLLKDIVPLHIWNLHVARRKWR